MESKIVNKNGNAFIEIDGECFEPLMFRSFRPTPANVSLFHRNGVKLFQMLVSGLFTGMDTPYSLFGPVWIDKGEYDFSAFDRQMELFKRFAPDSYYCIFIQLDAPQKWLERHPGHESSFEHLECGAFDEEWKRDASEYVRALIDYAEENYGDCIFGYAFCAGRSCEWFASPNHIEDRKQFSQPFSEYCKKKGIQFDNYLATWDDIWKDTNKPLYEANSAEAHLIDFGAEKVSELVSYFAEEIQKSVNHKKVIGTFFGYHCMRSSTNMAYLNEKVFADNNIDIIFSPAEYDEFRKIDACSGFQLAINSLEVHNKLYLHEVDHRTNLAWYPMEHAVGGRSSQYRMVGGILNDCYETEYESVMVLRRELAMTMQNGSAMWWFDFFGGYYAAPTYEKELKLATKVMKKVYESPIPRKSIAEVALIIDNRCFKYIHEGSDLKWDLIRWNLLNLGNAGIPFDMYNACDMDKIDFSQYKMVVFTDLFEMNDETKNIIKEKLNATYKVWLYAPNYITDGKFDIAGISEITEMELAPYIADKTEAVYAFGEEFTSSKELTDMFEVKGDAEVLGTYKNSGKTAIAKKGFNIYSSAAKLPPKVWRSFAEKVGVHLYTDGNGTLIMNSQFVCYQNANSENCRLVFDRDYEFEELFDGGNYKTENKVLEYKTEKGRTKLFYIK